MAQIYKSSIGTNDASERLSPGKIKRRTDLESSPTGFNKDGFVYVPSIKLYVARERSLLGKNWFEAHELLQAQGSEMLTLPEFVEFLKYVKANAQDIYEDVTAARYPWRAEWIDADFKVVDGKLHINSQHKYQNGKLIPQVSEPLDKNTLMKDRVSGISLDSWISNPTKQGLPIKKCKKGDLFYSNPRSDNNSFAVFGAGLDVVDFECCGDPSDGGIALGVRAVKRL